MPDIDWAYVAFHSCGRIVAASVDCPENKEHIADDVASWIRRGDRVERLSLPLTRNAVWCQCKKPPDA